MARNSNKNGNKEPLRNNGAAKPKKKENGKITRYLMFKKNNVLLSFVILLMLVISVCIYKDNDIASAISSDWISITTGMDLSNRTVMFDSEFDIGNEFGLDQNLLETSTGQYIYVKGSYSKSTLEGLEWEGNGDFPFGDLKVGVEYTLGNVGEVTYIDDSGCYFDDYLYVKDEQPSSSLGIAFNNAHCSVSFNGINYDSTEVKDIGMLDYMTDYELVVVLHPSFTIESVDISLNYGSFDDQPVISGSTYVYTFNSGSVGAVSGDIEINTECKYLSCNTVTAVVSPSDASDSTLNWTYNWTDPSSSWANGLNVTDYIQCTVSDDTLSVLIDCIAPFGETITLKATSVSTPTVSSECLLHYNARIESVCMDVVYSSGTSSEIENALYLDSIDTYTVMLGDYIYSDIYTVVNESLSSVSLGIRLNPGFMQCLPSVGRPDLNESLYIMHNFTMKSYALNLSSSEYCIMDFLYDYFNGGEAPPYCVSYFKSLTQEDIYNALRLVSDISTGYALIGYIDINVIESIPGVGSQSTFKKTINIYVKLDLYQNLVTDIDIPDEIML